MQAKQEIEKADVDKRQSEKEQLVRIDLLQALANQKNLSDQDYIKQVQSMEFRTEDFRNLTEFTLSQENEKIFLGVTGFRRILSFREPPIQAVIDANLISKFLSFLQRTDFPKL